MRVFLWYERYARLLDWMDANWFKGEFPNGAGNWRLPLSAVESSEFPHGVAAVSELAHASPHPLAMIMWVEPERVAAGSYIATNFPEYVFGCAAGNSTACLAVGVKVI
jgi:hypothetical protein